jgi:hypothetical protein
MSYCFRLINRAASARATSLGARALSSSPATMAAGGAVRSAGTLPRQQQQQQQQQQLLLLAHSGCRRGVTAMAAPHAANFRAYSATPAPRMAEEGVAGDALTMADTIAAGGVDENDPKLADKFRSPIDGSNDPVVTGIVDQILALNMAQAAELAAGGWVESKAVERSAGAGAGAAAAAGRGLDDAHPVR